MIPIANGMATGDGALRICTLKGVEIVEVTADGNVQENHCPCVQATHLAHTAELIPNPPSSPQCLERSSSITLASSLAYFSRAPPFI